MNIPVYNIFFTEAWIKLGFDLVYQPSCLKLKQHDDLSWPIEFPKVDWKDNTVVLMHTQDYLTIVDGKCVELEAIEQHFGHRANRVCVIHWNCQLDRVYDGPCHLIYFPTHSFEILSRLDLPSYKNQWFAQSSNQSRTNSWQCLNGIDRWHRRSTVNWLKPYPNGIFSLGDEYPLESNNYQDAYVWDDNNDLNERNFISLGWLYFNTKLNIVTETIYDYAPGIISEKTLFAFLAQQIPIIIGYQGIIQDLRHLGFDMFDDLVDHSYDTEPNQTRWLTALERNRHLIENPLDLTDCQDRLQKQQQFALNLPRQWIRSYERTVLELSQRLRSP